MRKYICDGGLQVCTFEIAVGSKRAFDIVTRFPVFIFLYGFLVSFRLLLLRRVKPSNPKKHLLCGCSLFTLTLVGADNKNGTFFVFYVEKYHSVAAFLFHYEE